MIFTNNFQSSTAGPRYIALQTNHFTPIAGLSVFDFAQLLMTRGGTIDSLHVQIQTPPTTTPFVLTICQNSFPTLLSVTIPIGLGQGANFTDVITIFDGDWLVALENDVDNANNVKFSFRFLPF